MGSSVKFGSRINGSFSKKIIMGQFLSRKKDKTVEGGSEGCLAKDQTFYVFFSGTLPLGSLLFDTISPGNNKRSKFSKSDKSFHLSMGRG